MESRLFAAALFVTVLVALFASACGPSSPTVSPVPSPTASPTPPVSKPAPSPSTSPVPPPPPPPPASVPPLSPPTVTTPTAGQLAAAGQTVFANSCKCHGDKGQGATGPPVIGANASLGKYQTAQGLLNFLDAAMPLNAPGSLSAQQYQQVLAFLLVQNQYLKAESIFDQSQLKNIPLK